MYVVNVDIHVIPEHVEAFIAATENNARNSWNEPGCHRFDVSQSVDDPTQFNLYEVYESEDGFLAHKQTTHYAKWNETVAVWMAQPREAVKLTNLFYTGQ